MPVPPAPKPMMSPLHYTRGTAAAAGVNAGRDMSQDRSGHQNQKGNGQANSSTNESDGKLANAAAAAPAQSKFSIIGLASPLRNSFRSVMGKSDKNNKVSL